MITFAGHQPSGSELQKSIQIATNVLSFSNSKNAKHDDSCRGCCGGELPGEPGYGFAAYGQPEIQLTNGTRKMMLLSPTLKNVTAQICANPPVDRIILETPLGELLKPGQHSFDKGLSLQSWPTSSKVARKAKLCTDVGIFAQEMSKKDSSGNPHHRMLQIGKYTLMAKNRFGFAEISLQLKAEPSNKASEAKEIIATTALSKCDSVHGQFTKSLIMFSVFLCKAYNLS